MVLEAECTKILNSSENQKNGKWKRGNDNVEYIFYKKITNLHNKIFVSYVGIF